MPPDNSTTVVIRLAGELESTGPYRLAVAPQAAAEDDVYAIEVVGVGPWVTGPVAQPQPGRPATLNVPFRRT